MFRGSLVLIIFLVCIKSFAQDPTPIASFPFEKDQQYQIKILKLKVNYEINKDLVILNHITDLAFIYKDWETVIEFQQELIIQDPSASHYFILGAAAGFRALKVSPFSSFSYVKLMKLSFLKSFEIDPTNLNVLKAQVDVYASLPGFLGGDIEIALKYVRKIKNLNIVEGLIAEAEIYEKIKQADQAALLYKDVFREIKTTFLSCSFFRKYLKSSRRDLGYDLGRIAADYKLENDLAECALDYFASTYEMKDTIPEAWVFYQQARIAIVLKGSEASKKFILKALLLQPKFPEVLELKEKLNL